MNSLEIYSFKENIKKFIAGQALPKEVVRMCLKEIYEESEKSAYQEILKEAEEREANGCSTEEENCRR